MTKARGFLWLAVCGVVAVVVVWSSFALRKEKAALPAIIRYSNLPDAFHQKLHELHLAVETPGYKNEDLRRLAGLYQANRLFPEARACYRVLAAEPNALSARDHYYLADIAQNENDLAAAQNELRAVLAIEPNYLPARLALAESYFKAGEADQAANEYAAILKIDAGHPQASVGLARIELQRGDDAAALSRLEKLLVRQPDSSSAAAMLAKILERRGDVSRASVMTQRSLLKPEPIPADPWLSDLLQNTYDLQRLGLQFEEFFKNGQVNEAATVVRRIEELDSQNPLPHRFNGWAQARAQHTEDAVREYRLALRKGGDPEQICPGLVQCLWALGKEAEAAKLAADYYAKFPESVPIAIAYSEIAMLQKNDALAQMLLEKILQKEPYRYPQNMSLAKILWTSGKRAEAAQCLKRAALKVPDDIPSRALLGEFYLDQSDPLSAIPPLEQAIEHAPASGPVRDQLSELLGAAYYRAGNGELEKGRLAEASGYFEKSVRLIPNDLNVQAGIASVCVLLKQFGRAAEALEAMVSKQPRNPTIYLTLGDVLYQSGDRDRAAAQWRKALAFVSIQDSELRRALDDRLSGRVTEETFK